VKFLSSLIMLTLLTSCFGLFDSKRDTSKIQIDPTNYANEDVTEANPNEVSTAASGITADRISLVMIDQKTVQKYGSQIVPRSDIAKVIAKLASDYEVNVGFVNFMFGELRDADQDSALIDALEDSGNFFLSANAFDGEGTPSELADVWVMGENDGSIIDTAKVAVPIEKIVQSAAGIGFVTIKNDNLPLLVSYQGKLVVGAPLKIAEAYLGEKAQFYKGYVSLGGKSIKLTNAGTLDVTPSRKGAFNAYSFVDVLNGSVPNSELNGDIVILGVGDVSATENLTVPEAIADVVMRILNQ
jgi:CHASE2 domain-containing sensor protein